MDRVRDQESIATDLAGPPLRRDNARSSAGRGSSGDLAGRKGLFHCLAQFAHRPNRCGLGDSNQQWRSAAFAACGATGYTSLMIRSFRQKVVERFFRSGSRAGIHAAHSLRLARQLSALDAATRSEDMNRPEPSRLGLEPGQGGLSGHGSVSVNGNWRPTLAFENGDDGLVDDQDDH